MTIPWTNHFLFLISVWMVHVSAQSSNKQPSCRCDAYYTYEVVQAKGCFPANQETLFLTRDLLQAEYLCSNFANITGWNVACRKFVARQGALQILRAQQQVETWTLWNISIGIRMEQGIVQDNQDQDWDTCEPATVKAVHTLSKARDSWIPETRCQQAKCPEALLAFPNKTHVDLQRFINSGNRLVCNIDACPGCACQTNTCQCSSLWTGDACQYYRPESCCWPRESPSLPNQQPRVCSQGGVCRFSSDFQSVGLDACRVSSEQGGAPSCIKCPEDGITSLVRQLDKGESALGGPRCNISACSTLLGGPGECEHGKCLSTCLDRFGHKHWCYKCQTEQECRHIGYECKCEQNEHFLWLGPTCAVDGSRGAGTKFTYQVALASPDDIRFAGRGVWCHTFPDYRDEMHTWLLDYEDANPYICAGHGQCVPSGSGRWQCACVGTFFRPARCFYNNPCLESCNPDENKAQCIQDSRTKRFSCECKRPWFTGDKANLSNPLEICGTNGCDATLLDDQGQTLAAARWTGQDCTCPSGVRTEAGQRVVSTTWATEHRDGSAEGLGFFKMDWSRHGCRLQCPLSDVGECGDDSPSRCSDPLYWVRGPTPVSQLPTLSCDCTQRVMGSRLNPITQQTEQWPKPARILNAATGSCDVLCVHGSDHEPGVWTSGCDCPHVLTACCPQGKGWQPIWQGPRCNQTRCLHGTTWNEKEGMCDCSTTQGEYTNTGKDDDIWCGKRACEPPKTYTTFTRSCECAPPRDPITCCLRCVHGFAHQCDVCLCEPVWTGWTCNTTLCAPGSVPSPDGMSCICSDTELVSGLFCNETRCDLAHTHPPDLTSLLPWLPISEPDTRMFAPGTSRFLHAARTTCDCIDVLFAADPTCHVDVCSALYPDTGRAVFQDNQAVFHCQCPPYTYPEPFTFQAVAGQWAGQYVTVQVCGCPEPAHLLDPCDTFDQEWDARCVLYDTQTKQVWRCICPQGQVLQQDVCQPLPPPQAGIVLDASGNPMFRLVDGFWNYVCQPGWSGLLCGDRNDPDPSPTHDCASGYWNAEFGHCDCPDETVRLLDPLLGEYCALQCQHDGVYQMVSRTCHCLPGWQGRQCERATEPVETDSSSTGGDDEHYPIVSERHLTVGALSLGQFLLVLVGCLIAILLLACAWTEKRRQGLGKEWGTRVELQGLLEDE